MGEGGTISTKEMQAVWEGLQRGGGLARSLSYRACVAFQGVGTLSRDGIWPCRAQGHEQTGTKVARPRHLPEAPQQSSMRFARVAP